MKWHHLFALALGACTPSKTDIRSEIGSDSALPPAKVYPDEEISITLWNSRSDSPDQVSILIEPNRTLYVRKYEVDWLQGSPEIETETLDTTQIDEDMFNELRERLSAYRPPVLSSSGRVILPKNCDFRLHGLGVINVAFRDAKEQSGIFVLQRSCVGPSAAKIESDLKEILSMLPELDGISGYGWGVP